MRNDPMYKAVEKMFNNMPFEKRESVGIFMNHQEIISLEIEKKYLLLAYQKEKRRINNKIEFLEKDIKRAIERIKKIEVKNET